MKLHQQQARDLIDFVADTMDGYENQKDQYAAGRQIVFAYHLMHPHQHYAFHQASLYVTQRLQLESV